MINMVILSSERKVSRMDFSDALIELKNGSFIARSGWNGANMFVYLVKGTRINKNKLRNEGAIANEYYDENRTDCETHIQIGSHIDMRAADGSIVVGWLASQTDMLENDWEVIRKDGK